MWAGLVGQICGYGNVRLRNAQRYGFNSWGTVASFTELGAGCWWSRLGGIPIGHVGHGTGFTRSGETLLADDTASRDQLCDHAEPVCPSPQPPDAQQVTFPGNLDTWVAWVVV